MNQDNVREEFEKAYAEKYGIDDDEYPEFFRRRDDGRYLSYRCQSDWEFYQVAHQQGRQSMRDNAVKVCEEQSSLCMGDSDECCSDSITDCIEAIKELK